MKRAPLLGCGFLMLGGLLLSARAGRGETKLGDVVKDVLDTMDNMTAQLATIKDEDSAKTATPELRKAALRWKELHSRAKKMKPPSKEESERLRKEYKEKLEVSHKKLFGEIARVKKVPGGKQALKEIQLVVEKKVL